MHRATCPRHCRDSPTCRRADGRMQDPDQRRIRAILRHTNPAVNIRSADSASSACHPISASNTNHGNHRREMRGRVAGEWGVRDAPAGIHLEEADDDSPQSPAHYSDENLYRARLHPSREIAPSPSPEARRGKGARGMGECCNFLVSLPDHRRPAALTRKCLQCMPSDTLGNNRWTECLSTAS